jgi:ArsR family transcriptional regulator, arsenate/arsenite/antimonite-responsive transcriptional repressor
MAPSTTGEDAETEAAAIAFKALSDPRRLAVLRLLLEVPDTLCGCEMSDVLGLADYQVSRALGSLKAAGLVREKARTGTWIHYEAARDVSPATDRLLALVAALPLPPDRSERLSLRYGLREQAGCVLGAQHPSVLEAFESGDLRGSLPVVATEN